MHLPSEQLERIISELHAAHHEGRPTVTLSTGDAQALWDSRRDALGAVENYEEAAVLALCSERGRKAA